MELEAQLLEGMEKEKEKLQADLQTTQSILVALDHKNTLLEEVQNTTKATLKDTLEDVAKTKVLFLTLAEVWYGNFEKAYKVLM